MIYGTSTSTFPDDAYVIETDNPETAHEIIDNALKPKDERAIAERFGEWLDETARDYFAGVGDWNEEWRDAWRDKIIEII